MQIFETNIFYGIVEPEVGYFVFDGVPSTLKIYVLLQYSGNTFAYIKVIKTYTTSNIQFNLHNKNKNNSCQFCCFLYQI